MTDEVTIPAGMKAWAGGDAAPADWQWPSPVMLRDGGVIHGMPADDLRWAHTGAENHRRQDIIAYTPMTPEPAQPAEAWLNDPASLESGEPAQPAESPEARADTLALVQVWLGNADYDPTQFDRDFAAAIDARVSARLAESGTIGAMREGLMVAKRAILKAAQDTLWCDDTPFWTVVDRIDALIAEADGQGILPIPENGEAASTARPTERGAVEWPDIGVDPLKAPRPADRYEASAEACRAAYVRQQPHVPDQTALVWRWHLGTLLEQHIRLKSILSDDGEPATDQAAEVERDAARWRALWSSDRIRMMGCAGFDFADDGTVTVREGEGWAHMGMEVWDKHPAKDGDCDVRGRKVLLAYVDSRAALTTQPATGRTMGGEEAAWRDGFDNARRCISEDEAFCLTEDVEEDAWRDSDTRAALQEPRQ